MGGHGAVAEAAAAIPSINPPGIVYQGTAANGSEQLFLTNLTGSNRHRLTSVADAVQPRWGPHGNRVAYLSFPERGQPALRIVDADGRHDHVLRVLGQRRFVADLAWAPDGRRLALVMTLTAGGFSDVFIYTIRTDTLTRLRVNSTPDRDPSTVDWSHDGQHIAFSAVDYTEDANDFEDHDLYTVNADGTGLLQLTNTTFRDEVHPRWSPDDSRLLFSKRGVPGCDESAVHIAADGSDRTRVAGGCDVAQAGWSPTGRRLIVQKLNSVGEEVLWTMGLDGTRRELIGRGLEASYRPRF